MSNSDEIYNVFDVGFLLHFKIILVNSNRVKWLIWVLRNFNYKFIKLNFGFNKKAFELE